VTVLVTLLLAVGQTKKELGDLDVMCGGHTLYIALATLDFPVGTFDDFQKRLGRPSQQGYSLLNLEEAAKSVGADAASVRGTLAEFAPLLKDSSIVALMSKGHYVVVQGFDDQHVSIADPPDLVEMPRSLFDHSWSGDALIVSRSPVPKFGPRPSSGMAWWIGGGSAVAAGLAVFAMRRRRRG
jgi:ABC-type bacteriocin/lantibiotic exporter with double-glycine peptidase domain